MHENTEFTTSRDIEAIQIPMGNTFTIPAGTPGVITQSLGGSYTIATYHGLARVSERDVDALGLEPSETQPRERTTSNGEVSEENVWNQPQINSYIKQNYILVSLYVDDREKLPVLERFTYET